MARADAATPGIRLTLKKNNVQFVFSVLNHRIDLELEASANRVKHTTEARMPQRTGQTAGSGEVVKQSEYPPIWHVLFSFASIYLEWGTVHMAARPSLIPSAQEEAPELLRRLAITTQGRIRSRDIVRLAGHLGSGPPGTETLEP